MIKGKQSIAFEVSPYLEESASVVGKKEGEGPLGGMFDMVAEKDLFGENTWEEAESRRKHVFWLLVKHIWHRRVSVICSVEIC